MTVGTKSTRPAAKTNGKPATDKNAFTRKPRVNRRKVQPDTATEEGGTLIGIPGCASSAPARPGANGWQPFRGGSGVGYEGEVDRYLWLDVGCQISMVNC